MRASQNRLRLEQLGEVTAEHPNGWYAAEADGSYDLPGSSNSIQAPLVHRNMHSHRQ